jgi:hypothetical protein
MKKNINKIKAEAEPVLQLSIERTGAASNAQEINIMNFVMEVKRFVILPYQITLKTLIKGICWI